MRSARKTRPIYELFSNTYWNNKFLQQVNKTLSCEQKHH